MMLRDKIKPYADQIRRREITNRALAHTLGASEWQVCRVIKQLNIKREPAPSRESQRALIESRQEMRRELANNPNVTPEQAARQAKCSVRTIYRYRSK